MGKGEEKALKNGEMTAFQSMLYTIKMIWKADKGCVIFSFYKNSSEELFHAFFFIYLTQAIYTYIEEKTPYMQLVKLIVFFCCLHILIHFAAAGHAYYIRLKTPVVYRHLFLQVIKKATTIDLMRYEQPDFYDKFSRALDECLTKVMDGLADLTWTFGGIFSSFASMAIIAAVDPILLFFILPPVIGSFVFGNKQNKEYYALRVDETHDRRVMEYAKRVFYEKKYAGEIRLYNIKEVLFQKHVKSYEGRYKINVSHRKKIALYEILEKVVFMGITFFSSYIYITFILKASGGEKIGAYVAMLSAIGFLTYIVKETVKRAINAGKNCMYMNNLKEFMAYEPVLRQDGTLEIQESLGDIEFEHVTFQYAGASQPVIEDLSFTIKKGERIALVGENGAGKTTLIKILMGLYPLTGGQIRAGGHNISEYPSKNYRQHFGTVFQDLQIFALPLSENVLMKTPETKEERQLVVDSLVKAQFGDKLETLPKGIDTMVTKEFDEEGFVCSGGQAQKIAIARVFAKDPDIVILDEPSSALDPIAEYNMYLNMMQVSVGKTVFFISHRLSSARIADKIYFLEDGKILEQGTHDELISKNGKYAQMFLLQAQNYRDNVKEQLNLSEMEGQLHAKF